MFRQSIVFGVLSIVSLLACGNDEKEQASVNDELSGVCFEGSGPTVQLWVMPDRTDLDIQKISDKHLPVSVVHSVGLIIEPPKGFRNEKLSIAQVAKMKSLTDLDLSGTKVADKDLETISQLSNLEILVLDWTKVSGSGFKHLARCKKLRVLSVHGCQLDDFALGGIENPGITVVTGEGHTRITRK